MTSSGVRTPGLQRPLTGVPLELGPGSWGVVPGVPHALGPEIESEVEKDPLMIVPC
jgi:hypothetical protein